MGASQKPGTLGTSKVCWASHLQPLLTDSRMTLKHALVWKARIVEIRQEVDRLLNQCTKTHKASSSMVLVPELRFEGPGLEALGCLVFRVCSLYEP